MVVMPLRDSLFGRAIITVPSPLPHSILSALFTPTHRRARGAGVRGLILLQAALPLCHGTQPILHSPEQHGVQVSILARGHLNDWGTQRAVLS